MPQSEETCKQQISFSELVHSQWHSRLAKSDFKRIAATTKTTVRLQGRGPVYIEGRSTAITKAVGLLKSRVESWGNPSDIKSVPGSNPHPVHVKYSLHGCEAKYSSPLLQTPVARGPTAASTDVQQFSDDPQWRVLLADMVRQINTTIKTRAEDTKLAFGLKTTLGMQVFCGRGLPTQELSADQLSRVVTFGFQEDGKMMKARFCSALHPAQLQHILYVAEHDLEFRREPTQRRFARAYLSDVDTDAGYQFSYAHGQVFCVDDIRSTAHKPYMMALLHDRAGVDARIKLLVEHIPQQGTPLYQRLADLAKTDGMLYLHSTVWDKAFSEARNEFHVFTDAWTETVEMGDAPSNDLAGSDAALPAQLQALHSFCAEVAAKVAAVHQGLDLAYGNSAIQKLCQQPRRSPDSPDKYCVPFLRGPSTVTPAVLAPFFAKDATPSTSALSSTARRAGPPKLGAARKQGDSDDDTSDSPKFQAAAKKIKRGPKEDKWPSLAPSS
ncbi:hypothetical protein WJX82_001084 [Trebouxia sp. C0006]